MANKIKTYASILLIATGLIVVGTISNAGQKEDNLELFQTVKSIVPIWQDSLEHICDSAPEGTIYFGFYHPVHNEMIICEGLTPTQFYETLRHESIHLAQDCMAGFDNSDLITIHERAALNSVHDYYALSSLALYRDQSPEIQWLEYEAFIFEQRSPKEVLDLLKFACKL